MESWLLYNNFISPVVFISFAGIPLCCYVLSPILAKLTLRRDQIQRFGQKATYLHSHLGSTIHAVIAFICASIILARGDLAKDKVYAVSTSGVLTAHVTAGYVLGDTSICLIDPYLRTVYSTLFHHLAMIFGLFMSLYHRLFLYFVVYRLLAEFSTPFVNWRAVLYETGNKKSMWYSVASWGMLVSFFLCRVMVIPWHTYALLTVLQSPEAATVPLSLKAIMLLNFPLFDLLNIFWFYKMLKGAYKLFFRNKSSVK